MDAFAKLENINKEKLSLKMEEPQMLTSFKQNYEMWGQEAQNKINGVELQKDSQYINMPPREETKSQVVLSKLDISNRIALRSREERRSNSDRSRVREKENFKNLVAMTSKEERDALPEDIQNIYRLLDEYSGIDVTAVGDASKESKMNIFRFVWRVLFRKGKKRAAIRKEEESLRDARFGIIAALEKYGKDPAYERVCGNLRGYLTSINKTMGMIPDDETCKTREEKYEKKGWDMKGKTVLDTTKRGFQMTGDGGAIANMLQGKRIHENRNDTPLFAHEPCMEDIRQGAVGDCWFLASLARVVKDDPKAIRDMMLDNADGTVTVRFFAESKTESVIEPFYVTVNKDVQTNYALDCFWVQIMEKAYAAFRQETAEKDEKGRSLLERGEGKKRKIKKIKDNVIDYGFIDGGAACDAIKHLTGRKGRSEDMEIHQPKGHLVCDVLVDKMRQINPEARAQKKLDDRIAAIDRRINKHEAEVDAEKARIWDKKYLKYSEDIEKFQERVGIKKITSLDVAKQYVKALEELKDKLDKENAPIIEYAKNAPNDINAQQNLKDASADIKTAERLGEILADLKGEWDSVELNKEVEKLQKDKEALQKQKDRYKGGLTCPPEMTGKVKAFVDKYPDVKDDLMQSLSDVVTDMLRMHEMAMLPLFKPENDPEYVLHKDYRKLQGKMKKDDNKNILFHKMKPSFYKEYLKQMAIHLKGEKIASKEDEAFAKTSTVVATRLKKFENVALDEAEELIKEWMSGIVETMKKNIDTLPSTNYKEPQRDAFSGDYSGEDDEQWEHMKYLIKNDAILSAGTRGKNDQKSNGGIVEGHAYTVDSIEEIGNCRFVKLRNPHGVFTAEYKKNEKTGMYDHVENKEDTGGVFMVEFSNFRKYYDSLDVNERKGA